MTKKNWIQNAVKKPGALRKSLGVKKGKKIPAGKLKAAAVYRKFINAMKLKTKERKK